MQQPLESCHPLSFPHKLCWLLQTLLRSSALSSHNINSWPAALLFQRLDHGITFLLKYVNDMINTSDYVLGI